MSLSSIVTNIIVNNCYNKLIKKTLLLKESSHLIISVCLCFLTQRVLHVLLNTQIFLLSQEHHENRRDLVIPNAQINQTIYVYQCKETTLQVKGKCNAIFVGQYPMLVL